MRIDTGWGLANGWGGCDHGENGGGVGEGAGYDDTFAKCGYWKNIDELKLDLGDGYDRLQVGSTTPARFLISVEGKDGNDDIDVRDGGGVLTTAISTTRGLTLEAGSPGGSPWGAPEWADHLGAIGRLVGPGPARRVRARE